MTITTWWMLLAAIAVISATPLTRMREGRGYPMGLAAACAAALVAVAISFPSGPANGALAPLWALVAVGCVPIVVDSLLDRRRPDTPRTGGGTIDATPDAGHRAATDAATSAATTCTTTIVG